MCRPSGAVANCTRYPTVETAGYGVTSLRDFEKHKCQRLLPRAFMIPCASHRRSLSMIGDVYIGCIAGTSLQWRLPRRVARRDTIPRGLRVH